MAIEMKPKTFRILTSIAGGLFGVFLLMSLWVAYWEHGKLQKRGVETTGFLTKATKKRVNFIPIGQTFEVAYSGTSQTFKVDREVFDRYVNQEGQYRVNAPIPVRVMKNKPDIAELSEMMDKWAWSGFDNVISRSLIGLILLLGAGAILLISDEQAAMMMARRGIHRR